MYEEDVLLFKSFIITVPMHREVGQKECVAKITLKRDFCEFFVTKKQNK